MRSIRLPIVLFLAAWSLSVSGQPAMERPAGDFAVIDLRRAGDVSGGPRDDSAPEAPGATVRFGETLVWWDGSRCENWSVMDIEHPPVNLADPILSDTQVGPVDGPRTVGDRRRNRHVEISCGGKPFAAFTEVDRRVLIAPSPSGLTYLIMERPLPAGEVRRFQAQLRTMKFLEREPSGIWDDAGLAAVSAYADHRGAEYSFNRAAITENLLDGLGILAPDEGRELIKIVYSGAVAAYFYGEELELVPRSYGVRLLAFRFTGDDGEYVFSPAGELFATDWGFEIFSPDGSRLALLQDRFGPYHVVETDHLKAYLSGAREPDHVVGKVSATVEDPAAVHSDARWISDTMLAYSLTCCGEMETVRWRIPIDRPSGPDGASLLQYRPALSARIETLPAIGLDNLTAAIIHLGTMRQRASENPGRWSRGNIALGADPDEYVPSDEELLAAEYGDRLATFMNGLTSDQIAGAWKGRARMPGPIAYNRFLFRRVDVMGSGRFYYASPPQTVSRDFGG